MARIGFPTAISNMGIARTSVVCFEAAARGEKSEGREADVISSYRIGPSARFSTERGATSPAEAAAAAAASAAWTGEAVAQRASMARRPTRARCEFIAGLRRTEWVVLLLEEEDN
jgi:hypothetical protein